MAYANFAPPHDGMTMSWEVSRITVTHVTAKILVSADAVRVSAHDAADAGIA